MIQYNFEIDFELEDQDRLSNWIHKVVSEESCVLGDLNYVFCDDEYLHKINLNPSKIGILIYEKDLTKFLEIFKAFIVSPMEELSNGEAKDN